MSTRARCTYILCWMKVLHDHGKRESVNQSLANSGWLQMVNNAFMSVCYEPWLIDTVVSGVSTYWSSWFMLGQQVDTWNAAAFLEFVWRPSLIRLCLASSFSSTSRKNGRRLGWQRYRSPCYPGVNTLNAANVLGVADAPAFVYVSNKKQQKKPKRRRHLRT